MSASDGNGANKAISGQQPADAAPSVDEGYYYPEDVRPCDDAEDDHSTADFDLNAEIAAMGGPAATFERGAASHENDPASLPPDVLYPEGVRPSHDDEGDHSGLDFDIDAEIEAKLGPAVEAEATPPPPAPGDDIADRYPVEDNIYYYPEDERPDADHEDDHSTADFDLNAEIAGKLDGVAVRGDDLGHEWLDPEFIRPCEEDEEDHSGSDFDIDAEIERALGRVEDKSGDAGTAGAVFAAQTPPRDDDGVPPGLDDADAVHPDLASSLRKSMRYAMRGAAPESRNASENTDEEDAAPDEEDSGDDEGMPPPGDENSPDDMDADNGDESASSPDSPLESAIAGTVAAASENDAKGAPVPGDGDEDDGDENDEGDDEEGGDDGDDGEDGDDGDDGEDGEKDDQPMTLMDHFRELRKRLFRMFLWVLAGFFLCYPFAERIFAWLFGPLMAAMPDTSSLIYTSPPEAFFTFMKVSFVAGMFIASPMIFYQIWAFVAPGLYKEEKLYILPVAFFSAFFFISGGAFCYFIVFPFAFEFFMSYNAGIIQAMPALSETLSFVLRLLIAFGLVFELPLFVFFLARLGIVTAPMMRGTRRYAILIMFIVAAILTPPDVLSQLLMAGPLLLLYEGSIIIAALFGRKKPEPKDEDEEDEDDEEDDKLPARA